MKTFNFRKYLAEGWLKQESDAPAKYPKAEAYLEEHPELEIEHSVPDWAYDNPDYLTNMTEAGYMFISELEAILENEPDLADMAEDMIIVDDSEFNPPVDYFNYGDHSTEKKENLKEYTEGWDETVAEHMWNTVLHWKAKKWITEEEADQIRDIIGA